MAKRSPANLDEGVNMDSMMDNMTNVVGTLLLVLIIVQMGVKNNADTVEEELLIEEISIDGMCGVY